MDFEKTQGYADSPVEHVLDRGDVELLFEEERGDDRDDD